MHPVAEPMRLWLVVAFGLALGACAAEGGRKPEVALERQPAAKLPGWKLGTTHRYDLKLGAKAEFQPAAAEGFDFELRGVAEVTPVRVAGDETELLLQLSELQLSSQSGEQASQQETLRVQLSEPYLFTLARGSLRESRMVDSVGAEAGSLLRTLSSALQVAAADGTATTWQASETDATGVYTSEYRRERGVLHKKKIAYSKLLVTGDVPESLRAALLPQVLESQIDLTARDAALASVVLNERIQSKVALDQTVVVRNQLELRESARGAAAAVDLVALHARTHALAAALPIPSGPRAGRFDDVRIGKYGFDELFAQLVADHAAHARLTALEARASDGDESETAELRSQNDRARLESFSAMAALMRQDPTALPKAVAKVRAGSPVDEPLIDAIGSAGTADAQHVLAGLVSDARLAPALRQSAAMSLIRVREPIAANVAVLRALSSDPLLREYAVYGLGTASRRLRAADQQKPADDATDALLALLAGAPDDDARMIVLRGISNSADVRTLPQVKPFLSHAAHGVRHAALDALRLMPSPEADAWLAERLLNDGNASVQAAAIAAAGDRAPSSRLADALAEASLRGKDAIVRHRAVELASKWLDAQPALGGTLEKVAKDEEQPEIRELARVALAQRR